MKCDELINQACEALGSFGMIDAALLENTLLVSEFNSVQFKSKWSIFRPFASKKPPAMPTKLSLASLPFKSPFPWVINMVPVRLLVAAAFRIWPVPYIVEGARVVARETCKYVGWLR